jgi:cell division protein FtsB
MALTNDELESALTALSQRVDDLAKIILNSVSVTQLNAVTLLLQKDIEDLQTDMDTTKGRVATLEATVATLV